MAKYKATPLSLKKTLDDFMLPKSEVYELRERFKQFGTDRHPKRKQLYINRVSRLIEEMPVNGCTDEEMHDAIIFAYVVLDSDKYYLDILKAYDELGIKLLEDKYCN